MIHSHAVIHNTYVGDDKVKSLINFWNIDDIDYVCSGLKEVHIFHKLKAGFYKSNCKNGCDCNFRGSLPLSCVDEICSIAESLYPGYQLFGSKTYFKEYFNEKKTKNVKEKEKP